MSYGPDIDEDTMFFWHEPKKKGPFRSPFSYFFAFFGGRPGPRLPLPVARFLLPVRLTFFAIRSLPFHRERVRQSNGTEPPNNSKSPNIVEKRL